MATYYVFIPNYQFTAEVDASNSKHAKTAYLDYLTRNNMLSWKQRQAVRKNVRLTKVEPGEMQASVHIDYSMQRSEQPVVLEGAQTQEVAEEQPSEQYIEQPTPPQSPSPLARAATARLRPI